jgi:hypothetical protein
MISKREALEFLLARAPVVRVFARRVTGAAVPEDLADDFALDIGLNMPMPIPDLEVDDYGVAATLSFNRLPFKVWLPWAAVIVVGVSNEATFTWLDDVPAVAATASASSKRGLRLVD